MKRLTITTSKGAGIFFYKRVNDDVLVALGKRSESPFIGYWSFAGGNFDRTDVDFFSCAQREAKEEFFIEIVLPLRGYLGKYGIQVKRLHFT